MPRENNTRWFMGDETLIELMHALTSPDVSWAEPSRPGMLLALDELLVWIDDPRSFDDRMHVSGWDSAGPDLLDAADGLGQHLKDVVAAHLATLRSLWRNDIGGDAVQRQLLKTKALELRADLATTDASIAAWRDLHKACAQATRPSGTVAARRDAFWEVIRASDRNAEELSRSLTGVLSGSRRGALGALMALGDVDPANVDFAALRAAPDLPVAERLQLVERVLVHPVESHAHVVWFAFRQARLTSMGERLPAVDFFNAEWLHGNLFCDGPFSSELPAELTQLQEPAALPADRDVVLVRLDLGTEKLPDAIREAAQRVNALLGMATLGCAVPWQRLPGVIHVQDGNIVHHRYFEVVDQAEPSPYALDATAAQLARMAPRVAPRIPIVDPAAKDIVEALQWWRTGAVTSPAESLLLNVRVIELVASRLGETSWTTHLDKYLKNLWIYESLGEVLFRVFTEALHQRVPPEMHDLQRSIFLEVTSHSHGVQGYSVEKAAAYVSEMLSFTPQRSPLGRDLRTIQQRTASAAALQRWATELETQWNSSVHRLERVRNAVAHGGPFTDRAIQLVHPLSQKLSVWSLWESVEAVIDGRPLLEAFQLVSGRWGAWRSSLANANSIADIFPKR
ncbi:hypothetical protein JNW90_01615 [Micromonospora sp. STR1s_5]|nr:hypothetical protein [Micromonospora sp. STR1s_5]